MTIDHAPQPGTPHRPLNPWGPRIAGLVAIAAAASVGSFILGRATTPRLPSVGVTVETWDSDSGLGFAVIDSLALNAETLLKGEVRCADTEASVVLDVSKYASITQAQADAFENGVDGVCIRDVANLYGSALLVTIALNESGLLGEVLDMRRLQLGVAS